MILTAFRSGKIFSSGNGLMFTNRTVFILGAGASWHYGYPTGEELVRKIVSKSEILAEYFKVSADPPINGHRPDYIARNSQQGLASGGQIQAEWQAALKETRELAKRLKQVNPLVIDYFLSQNVDLQPIGKLMIALVILECEARFLSERGNENRRELLRQSPSFDERSNARKIALQFFKDDWCRFILHKSVMNCEKSFDILANKVLFVTFNYDVSLEYELDRGLRSISLFETKDVAKFLGGERILHVYGQVRTDPAVPPKLNFSLLSPAPGGMPGYKLEKGHMGNELKPLLDTAYAASKNIRVISPSDKGLNVEVIESAKKAIADATCVFVLGYGFDENNSKILDLFRALNLRSDDGEGKAVLFTNYEDINRVNKKASRLFFGDFESFLPGEPFIHGNPKGPFYCEKSVRDVYEALALDFDALEDQLISGSII
jgi:hypothetical protein